MDGTRVEMGPGDLSLAEDQGCVAAIDGRRGHRSGTLGDQPAVLMTVQIHEAPVSTPVPSPVGSVTSRTTALRLDRISLNVADLAAATAFYVGALGLRRRQRSMQIRVSPICLVRGRSASSCCGEDGSASNLRGSIPRASLYPAEYRSDDLWFQHCALVTDDIAAAYEQLSAFPSTPISRHGPQRLPGGIVAFKFRDPDGHPLELIQFPRPDPRTAGGIDHSAISVCGRRTEHRLLCCPARTSPQSRQVNRGPAQDALDDLERVAVDVVALAAKSLGAARRATCLSLASGPRLSDRSAIRYCRQPFGVCYTTVSITGTRGHFGRRRARVSDPHDPDGHALLLEQSR